MQTNKLGLITFRSVAEHDQQYQQYHYYHQQQQQHRKKKNAYTHTLHTRTIDTFYAVIPFTTAQPSHFKMKHTNVDITNNTHLNPVNL